MAVLNFLNENQFRSYPFKYPTADLPDAAIAEVVFVLGPGSGFDPASHTVWLASISGSGPWILTFQSDAPGLAGTDMRVVVPADAAEFSAHEGEG